MQISGIYVSQRKLRCVAQIPDMIETLGVGGYLPQITLSRSQDGSVQVEDGQHRLSAIWMTGRRELKNYEYLLLEKDQWRPRFGRITDLLERCGITAEAQALILGDLSVRWDLLADAAKAPLVWKAMSPSRDRWQACRNQWNQPPSLPQHPRQQQLRHHPHQQQLQRRPSQLSSSVGGRK